MPGQFSPDFINAIQQGSQFGLGDPSQMQGGAQMGLGVNPYAQSPAMNQFDAQGGGMGPAGAPGGMSEMDYMKLMQMGMQMMPGIRQQYAAPQQGPAPALGRVGAGRNPFMA
jgi:hypothetical protein